MGGFSILEEQDRIAIGYWENDKVVIFLSRAEQSHFVKVQGINSHSLYGYQSRWDEKRYAQI
ncbi:hypothetical protein MPUCK001_13670 [Citrobacter koseri]|nr:hypothetical protein MPUCK001_13670 [Citrobacter koseri]